MPPVGDGRNEIIDKVRLLLICREIIPLKDKF